MRPVSDKWNREVKQSHRALTKIEVLADGTATEIEVGEDGQVDLDFRAANRGRLRCKVHDPDLIPGESPADPLAPYGNELRVWRGIEYEADSPPEWTSIGIFGIDDNDITADADEASVAITAIDRSKRVERSSFLDTYTVASGTNAITAIEDVILDALPGTQMSLITSDVTLPLLVAQEGDDRWAFARGLATAVACDLYFDGDGILTMTPLSGGGSQFSIEDGEDGVIVKASKRQTREGMANYIITTGESSESDPVRAVAYDNDPLSPTYYQGKFGLVPYRYTSKYIETQTQADDAAEGVLNTMRGLVVNVNLGMVPNPALEPGDIVAVQRTLDDGSSLVSEDQIIDGVAQSLNPMAEMAVATRALSQVEVA